MALATGPIGDDAMEAVTAPGIKFYKNVQKANQLRIPTFFTES
jgi:hypothetical protein